ncbi:hypothetical protein ACGFIR_26720 [Micromonospora sp. NPDC049051]|uniref:hypothetical protein n=1 Tax=unclassified Micromonospora TaxID=2617518 RepID=UPI00371E297C
MTVRASGRPLTRLEIAQQHAEHVLGAHKAKRIAMFDNGALYVRPGSVALFLAWLIDFTVYVCGVVAGIVALILVQEPMGISDAMAGAGALALLVVVPVLYGLCYGNGRALGALLTGTQLVRAEDGGRVGVKACWAMLIRTLFLPVLLIAAMGAVPGGVKRLSVDPDASRQLYAAGIR